MTAESSVPRATDTITVLEGFDAMRVFLRLSGSVKIGLPTRSGLSSAALDGWTARSLTQLFGRTGLWQFECRAAAPRGSTILSTTMHRAHRAACIEMQDRDRVPIAYAPFCAGEPGLNGIEAASSLRKGWVNENVSDP